MTKQPAESFPVLLRPGSRGPQYELYGTAVVPLDAYLEWDGVLDELPDQIIEHPFGHAQTDAGPVKPHWHGTDGVRYLYPGSDPEHPHLPATNR